MSKPILIILTILLTIVLVIASHRAAADTIGFKYGMGLDKQRPTGKIKIFSVRSESPVTYGLHTAIEGGLWADNVPGHRSAGFAKWQMGVKPGPEEGLYAKAFWGVQAQSSTDTQLGSLLQFSQDAGLGIRDQTTFIELGYGHVSNAGLTKINQGRDFLSLMLGWRY